MADLAGGLPSSAGLDGLTAALRTASEEDPLTRVVRALEGAARAGTLTLDIVHDVTVTLLESLRVMAVELECSRPKECDPAYVGGLATMPIGGPLNPSPGEAMRVLAHAVEVTEHHFGKKVQVWLS